MDFDRSEINLKWKIWKIYSSIYKYKIYEIQFLILRVKIKNFLEISIQIFIIVR